MSEARVRIRFIVREAPWEAWDVVSLPAPEATKFLRRGVAEPMDDRPAERVPGLGTTIVEGQADETKVVKRARRG